ncbi:glycosyltransferase family A protein [Flavobacterium sp. LHD-85]|uniref:glycosyltransferase family 2 protein n=1 Tax=Flavobacterium sp. LHD-85 TaxID=3071410 RepID=UPI0027E06F6E|nr:glycosyltransferase family A protein [Flavobacterium sp. LHD-85]MDQ6529635.1 glycosyltransferase family A protein [Flavobacterium sp. LHD-85]
MIIVYHQNNKIVKVGAKTKNVFSEKKSIAKNLIEIAEEFPQDLIIWSHISLEFYLNVEKIDEIFHQEKIMASYNLSPNNFISDTIGYVDSSPFLKINKEVSYPTWMMSSNVGGIHASILLLLKNQIKIDPNFDYFLNSIARLGMSKGLLCYSDPKLLKDCPQIFPKYKEDKNLLFRFVKQHYKTRWIFLLFLDLFLYKRILAVFPFLMCFFYKKRYLKTDTFHNIKTESKNKVIKEGTIDVIIPTIGRKKYLYDTLKDFSLQTFLPINIVIVEQNPVPETITELDYILNENWPFKIIHIFTHQTGACNARNLALKEVKSEWVFMADDDIRIEADFLEETFQVIKKEGFEQITLGCYQPDYSSHKKIKQKFQWGSFGSGCSIVKTENIKTLSYNMSFEFGYGEDGDFGMQLRNLGYDIIYSPQPEILHLKAPIGGFRTKHILAWANEKIQPKPSPTVMLYKVLHLTQEQIDGYRTVLFFKYYRVQKTKNPIQYYFNYKKQWLQSLYWANKLNS